jgi:hypothetical protein
MSRPQKIVPPVKGSFQGILTSVALGSGAGKKAAITLAKGNAAPPNPITPPPAKK